MSENSHIAEAKAFFTKAFDGIIRIELMDEETAFWVDGRNSPPTISTDSPTGVDRHFCLWRIDGTDLTLILTRKQSRLENSFIAGRLKLSGDMSVMMRLETDIK